MTSVENERERAVTTVIPLKRTTVRPLKRGTPADPGGKWREEVPYLEFKDEERKMIPWVIPEDKDLKKDLTVVEYFKTKFEKETGKSRFLALFDEKTKKKVDAKNKEKDTKDAAVDKKESEKDYSKKIPKKISKDAVVKYVQGLAFDYALHYDGLTAAHAAEIYKAELATLAWNTIFNAIGKTKEEYFIPLEDYDIYIGILVAILDKRKKHSEEMFRIMQDIYRTMPSNDDIRNRVMMVLHNRYYKYHKIKKMDKFVFSLSNGLPLNTPEFKRRNADDNIFDLPANKPEFKRRNADDNIFDLPANKPEFKRRNADDNILEDLPANKPELKSSNADDDIKLQSVRSSRNRYSSSRRMFHHCNIREDYGTDEDISNDFNYGRRTTRSYNDSHQRFTYNRPRGRNNNGRYAYNGLRGKNTIHYRRQTPTSNTIRGLKMINAVQEKIRREELVNPTHRSRDIEEEFWC